VDHGADDAILERFGGSAAGVVDCGCALGNVPKGVPQRLITLPQFGLRHRVDLLPSVFKRSVVRHRMRLRLN